jgi:hypothetical protein
LLECLQDSRMAGTPQAQEGPEPPLRRGAAVSTFVTVLAVLAAFGVGFIVLLFISGGTPLDPK